MSQIQEAASVLKQGGVIIFPTDTVWGVGCLLTSKLGIEKLYRLKKRQPDKPTGIFVSDMNMAEHYGDLNDVARALALQYWPGALALVVKAKPHVPELILGPNRTISLRIPQNQTLIDLLHLVQEPIVQSSANFAGVMPPALFLDIEPEFKDQADYLIEGESGNSLPSTIVDATSETIITLRQGPIRIQ